MNEAPPHATPSRDCPERSARSVIDCSTIVPGPDPSLRAHRWPALNGQTDEELAESVLAGEQDALAVLFDRYHKIVYSIALRIVRDSGEAEEVVQTVFLDFYRALAQFDARKGILKIWLIQYAYHRALHRKRHLTANRFYEWVDLEDANAELVYRWNPADVARAARLMEQLLHHMSPRRRRILELTYFEGLTASEIALELGYSVHVVRHELYRGLAALRKELGERNQSDGSLAKGKEALNDNA
jgi:RNA polymerase sigma-70 factor, ECF subfamily